MTKAETNAATNTAANTVTSAATTAAMNTVFDVIVVGGGAAGLGGALTLARARRSVLVIDAGQPRNAPAEGVHGYLTRDGMSPSDLLAVGRVEVRGYGGQIIEGTVTSAARDSESGELTVTLADGSTLRARRLLIATGLVDELPDLPGLRELWGRGVVHCPYCHGWEIRDRAVGVLALGPLAVHQALLFQQWSADITFFPHTGPEPTAEQAEQFAARGIRIVSGEVSGLEVSAGRLAGVRLRDGATVPVQALAIGARMAARSAVLDGLGLKPTAHMLGNGFGEHIAAEDPSGRTSVPGVWVAGNVTDLAATVIGSAAAGVGAAAAINFDLVTEDTQRAVEALRAGDGDRVPAR
jgi:thioredoxin reductase